MHIYQSKNVTTAQEITAKILYHKNNFVVEENGLIDNEMER